MSFQFENSLGYHINRTASMMRQNLQRSIQKEYRGITVDYWVLLNRLWDHDGINQSELARLTGKDNASMTRILDGMQKKELISRVPDENDRRAFRIYLTDRGRTLENPLKEIAASHHEIATSGLSEEEIKSLKVLLRRIWESF